MEEAEFAEKGLGDVVTSILYDVIMTMELQDY